AQELGVYRRLAGAAQSPNAGEAVGPAAAEHGRVRILSPTASTLAVVTSAALAFAGCGSSGSSSETSTAAGSASSDRTVDTTTAEQQIQTKYTSSTVKVTKVTCPSGVP